MILIDTNIIIYSLTKDSPKKSLAQSFLLKTKNRAIAHQNITEALRLLTHPKFKTPVSLKTAQKSLIPFRETCTVIFPLPDTLEITLHLMNKYNLTSNLVFDAYLVATALSNNIEQIATDNVKDFKMFSEVEIINPF